MLVYLIALLWLLIILQMLALTMMILTNTGKKSEELYSGVPALPWPTSESLFYPIRCLKYDYAKGTCTIQWTLQGREGNLPMSRF